MRPIRLAIAAIAGAVETMGVGAADAQCSVFSRHPCVPDVCSVFSRHPCVPELLYPYGEDLRLTIVSAASDQPSDGSTPSPGTTSGADARAGIPDGERRLGLIHEMSAYRLARPLDATAAGRSASAATRCRGAAGKLQAWRRDRRNV